MSWTRLEADFNGLFGDLLCLSHSDHARDESGADVNLAEGMKVLAFEPDEDDGKPCFLVATGRVVAAPAEFGHGGSRWCLQVDARGVRHIPILADA